MRGDRFPECRFSSIAILENRLDGLYVDGVRIEKWVNSSRYGVDNLADVGVYCFRRFRGVVCTVGSAARNLAEERH